MSDAEVKPTRSGRLLCLLRRLIDYGKELAATLRNPAPGTDLDHHVRPFGTRNIALILARITRGLQLAGALETHIIHTADRVDTPPAPAAARAAAPPTQRAPAAPRAPRLPPAPTDPRLAQMPTPEEIAAQIRRRPIGAVIANICRDLGIMPRHPLWHDIVDAVVEFGGNFAVLYDEVITQTLNILKEPRPIPWPPVAPAAASTGPPQQSAA